MYDLHTHDYERRSDPFVRPPRHFGRHSRLFERGDMKYVILSLLKDKPTHGYDLSLALEERFHGLYSPSPGSIYPVLQLLEDMGYVTSSAQEGKKIYTVTESGLKFLEEQKATVERIVQRVWGSRGPEDREYVQDVRTAMGYVHDLKHLVGYLAGRRDAARLARVNQILVTTLKDVEGVFQEE